MAFPRKSRRRTQPRSKTLPEKSSSLARLLKLAREERTRVSDVDATMLRNGIVRPKTRADCEKGIRPCPFVSCKHHMYLDVSPDTGSIKINFPHIDPMGLRESCVLDVADRGGITLDETGSIMNVTRERVRQIETRGLLALQESYQANGIVTPDESAAMLRRSQQADHLIVVKVGGHTDNMVRRQTAPAEPFTEDVGEVVDAHVDPFAGTLSAYTRPRVAEDLELAALIVLQEADDQADELEIADPGNAEFDIGVAATYE